MASYKDPSGQWRFRKSIRLSDGRRERISGTPNANSRAAAERAEREAIDRLENPEKYPETATKKPLAHAFSTFVTEWLVVYPIASNKESTIDHRETHVRMHLLPYWQDTPLVDITAQRLMKFVADLKVTQCRRNTTGPRQRKDPSQHQDMLSAQTIRNILSTLHKVLTSAVSWKKLAALPEFPTVKVPKAEWDWLTGEESKILLCSTLKTGTADAHAALLFAVKTGARAGEQQAFQWEDIDWHNKTITIRRSIWRKKVADTKSGKERTIPMTPAVEAALKSIRHLRGPLVFCDMDGKHLSKSYLTHMLRMALRRAGLRRVRWHDLRHSFASQLVRLGVNLKQVQEWMGHSSIVTTMRYAHLAPTEGPKLIALLDQEVG